MALDRRGPIEDDPVDAGAEVTAERRDGRIDVVVREMVNEVIGSGGADRALRGRYGMRPKPRGL